MDNRVSNRSVAELLARQPTAAPGSKPAAGFDALLQDRLKVSGHAQTRLQSRNIHLGEAEWSRVAEGVERAAQKGAKESLVLMDDVALVVSVKNRTVITAVETARLKESVFTNIDSAVIV